MVARARQRDTWEEGREGREVPRTCPGPSATPSAGGTLGGGLGKEGPWEAGDSSVCVGGARCSGQLLV